MTHASSKCASAAAGPNEHDLGASVRPLLDWLIDRALPLWEERATDRIGGGFFELLDAQARPVEAPRRTRVVARQLYVHAVTAQRGWSSQGQALATHALDFLLGRLLQPEGHFASAVSPSGEVLDPVFDLYEQAFGLFGLAGAAQIHGPEARLEGHAHRLLDLLEARWSNPLGGFADQVGPGLMRANPHMHLLEAALAWEVVSDRPERWRELSDALVSLALDRMCDRGSGALREYFGADWSPVEPGPGPAVEPGHQFEWAWLLMRWSGLRGTQAADSRSCPAIQRFVDIGTQPEAQVFGVLVNGLNPGLGVSDVGCRLWPQTERIKALVLGAGDSPDAGATFRVKNAVGALLRFFDQTGVEGLWHERLDDRVQPLAGPSRTSSLYHIVGAAIACADAGARSSP